MALDSTCVVSAGYDARRHVLELEFPGGRVYDYLAVQESVHEELLSADSHGRYFNRRIRGHFDFRRVA
ncbi:KTSC domain-containing protein [Streptacidiphilus monticola]|jgi:hypothetical protein|uniref:KTSC domain-containing protein n=1 Tax=Streptacidiphilus monticola TaxID=2161674 RepID=A0ABW1G0P8_9ACTN